MHFAERFIRRPVLAGEQVVVGGLERMAEGMPIAPRPRTSGDSVKPARSP